MAPSGKPKARLKSVTVKLPWLLEAAWDSDNSELEVLRDLVDQLRTRRAFEVGRGMLLEEPMYFLRSVVETRDSSRKLLERLPVQATQSRLLLLTVMDWLAEILDVWHRAKRKVSPREWEFAHFHPHDMDEVMEASWPVIERVRDRLAKLRTELESQLLLIEEPKRRSPK